MRIPAYDETLKRYGLGRLREGDLQVRNGSIALTTDGDFQFGDVAVNALFRLVQRWSGHQPTLNALFEAAQFHSQGHIDIKDERLSGRSPSLVANIAAFHESTDQLRAFESGASIYAGAICLVVNNLLQRFKDDAIPTNNAWMGANPIFAGISLGEVFRAASNNFRHHDEWARTNPPTKQQMDSISVLQPVLHKHASSAIAQRIRTNVCCEVLMVVSDGDIEVLHERLFEYAKNVCDYSGARSSSPSA